MTIGPVQLLVFGFDEPSFTGEIERELGKLRDNEVIRLIDVLAVWKDADGEVTALQQSDLTVGEAEEVGAVIGALLGLGIAGEEGFEAGAVAGAIAGEDGHLIDESEAWAIADSIPNNSAAAIALIEHTWAIPLRAAIARAGGAPLQDQWIHPLDLVEVGLLAAEELELA